MSSSSRLFLACLCVALASSAVAASRLTNVSVRSSAGSGSDTLIVGFAINGTGEKQMLIRGIGPTLANFGVTGAVTDPQISVFNQANTAVAANDNWNGAASVASASAQVAAFALPTASRDAALLATLPAGSYSTHLTASSGSGIALVEAYDVDSANSSATIGNLSARSLAGTGANVLTIGFAITGDTPKTVLIRAVGPSLTAFGVGGALVNPQLQLFASGNTSIGENDDWHASAGWADAFTAVGAFGLAANTRDAALLVSLPPGSYTAQARGANSTTGVALIEVYDVPNPPATSFVLRPITSPTGRSTPSPGTGTRVTPAVLTQARPQYPFDLRRAGISGEALIEFTVNVTGRVENAFVVRATDIRLAEAALAAVNQWTFRAGTLNGEPIPFVMQIPIVFTLNEV